MNHELNDGQIPFLFYKMTFWKFGKYNRKR